MFQDKIVNENIEGIRFVGSRRKCLSQQRLLLIFALVLFLAHCSVIRVKVLLDWFLNPSLKFA